MITDHRAARPLVLGLALVLALGVAATQAGAQQPACGPLDALFRPECRQPPPPPPAPKGEALELRVSPTSVRRGRTVRFTFRATWVLRGERVAASRTAISFAEAVAETDADGSAVIARRFDSGRRQVATATKEGLTATATVRVVARAGIARYGRGGSNRLVGTPYDDRLFGRGGNDRLIGLAGDDRLVGGSGNDLVDAGPGDDVIQGSAGSDRLFGGGGDDRVTETGGGDDRIYGGAGGDVIRAGRGRDVVFAGSGDDVVFGGPSPDTIFCGPGNDTVYVDLESESARVIDCEIVRAEPVA